MGRLCEKWSRGVSGILKVNIMNKHLGDLFNEAPLVPKNIGDMLFAVGINVVKIYNRKENFMYTKIDGAWYTVVYEPNIINKKKSYYICNGWNVEVET